MRNVLLLGATGTAGSGLNYTVLRLFQKSFPLLLLHNWNL